MIMAAGHPRTLTRSRDSERVSRWLRLLVAAHAPAVVEFTSLRAGIKTSMKSVLLVLLFVLVVIVAVVLVFLVAA